MRIAQKKFLSAGDMSADVTSNPVGLNQDFGFSIQANFSTSGTLAGTLKLQGSVDHVVDQAGNVTNAGNWVDVKDSPQVISGSGSFIWNVSSSMFPFVRLVYVHAGGDTGSLDAWYMTRGV